MDNALPSLAAETELADRAARGDHEAFRLLLQRYGNPIYRYAYRLTGNHEDADDMAQETFVRVYQHLKKIDRTQPLKPWIYKICTNLCRNLAAKKRSIPFSVFENKDSDDEPSLSADSIPDDAPDPLDSLAERERAEAVRSAVEALPPKYGMVLQLHYFDDLSYEDMADALGLPLNTVRTHLSRAKAALAQQLRLSLQ